MHLSAFKPATQNNAFTQTRTHFKLSHQTHTKTPISSQEIHHMLANAAPYYGYVLSQVLDRNMPSEIALIPFVESNYNPFAYSLAGATGLWQMMPGTASGMGLKINWWYDGRRDIIDSTRAALNYLSYLHKQLNNDWLLAIAAYDAGEGRIKAAIARNQAKRLPTTYEALSLPNETRHYIPKLLTIATYIDHTPNELLPNISMTPHFVKVHVDRARSLKDIAILADTPIKKLRALNPGFRRWETGPKKSYDILIPQTQLEIFTQRTANEAQQLKASPYFVHVVQKGESLSLLAQKFHTTIYVIRELNQLHSNQIRIGMKLKVPHPPTSWLKWHKLVDIHRLRGDHMPGPKRKHYVVKAHDSLQSIAKRHHLKSSQIIFWNHLNSPKLKVGQSLQLWLINAHCPKGWTHVFVKSGDNVSKIAHRMHTTSHEIIQRNHLKHALIYPGQSLKIPCST